MAHAEGVREPGGEAVAAAVGVLDLAGDRRRRVRPARLRPAAERARGGDDEPRRRLELADAVALAAVLAAADERVELLARERQRAELAGGGDEHPCAAGAAERDDVAADEVGRVAGRELGPRLGVVVAQRNQLVAEHRDRPLAVLVDVAERAPLRLGPLRRVDADTGRLELHAGAGAEGVLAERGEEVDLIREPRELERRDRATPARLRPGLGRVHDLAWRAAPRRPARTRPIRRAPRRRRAPTTSLTDDPPRSPVMMAA